jgi:hypothetical protein
LHVAFVTQDDHFYMPLFFEGFLNRIQNLTVDE